MAEADLCRDARDFCKSSFSLQVAQVNDGGHLMTPEPFVSAQEAAKFVGISRRFLIDLARHGIAGAYPIGTGDLRKTWVFRLSELATAIDRKNDRGIRRPPQSERAYDPTIRRSLLK
jgi:hypothetical protein